MRAKDKQVTAAEIKMIVLDLDGTVLHSDKTISPYTIEILERCKRAGIKIAIATARSEMEARRYIEAIAPDVVISGGGSLVCYEGRAIYTCMLSAEISDAIIAECMAREEGLSITVAASDGYYVKWAGELPAEYGHAISCDFAKPLSQETYKIVVESSDEAIVKQIVDKYHQCSVIRFSDGEWYRIANKESEKMNAVKATAEYFDIDVSRVASFGDDFSDLEMIKSCGYGVSMGNAIDAVKAVGKHVCDTNDNDGVAKWIAAHLLAD